MVRSEPCAQNIVHKHAGPCTDWAWSVRRSNCARDPPARTSRTAKDHNEAMGYQSVNPYNGKTLRAFGELTDFPQRSAIAAKAAAIMRSRIEEFARPVTLEAAKLSIGHGRSVAHRHRYGARQSHDVDSGGRAIRRRQELGLRARTLAHGYSGVRKQKAGSRCLHRCCGVNGQPSIPHFSLETGVYHAA